MSLLSLKDYIVLLLFCVLALNSVIQLFPSPSPWCSVRHFTVTYHITCVCSGYNSMGYEMSKPNLRAELEADLKLVSEGRKDKRSVLQHHIQKYKTVFIESVRKAKK